MAVIASVHVADVGPATALRLLPRKPKPSKVPGLRSANLGLAAALTETVTPKPSLRRLAMVSFWDDESALDRFDAEHAIGRALAGGWQARLEPLRAHGSWPGLPDDVPKTRHTAYAGPSIVLTLGRMRLSQAPRFVRTSARAEGAVVGAPGNVWATGFASPPFVATCSLWESVAALSAYAFGPDEQRHADAIAEGRAKPFHKQEAFIRFRPISVTGELGGKNPLPAGALNLSR